MLNMLKRDFQNVYGIILLHGASDKSKFDVLKVPKTSMFMMCVFLFEPFGTFRDPSLYIWILGTHRNPYGPLLVTNYLTVEPRVVLLRVLSSCSHSWPSNRIPWCKLGDAPNNCFLESPLYWNVPKNLSTMNCFFHRHVPALLLGTIIIITICCFFENMGRQVLTTRLFMFLFNMFGFTLSRNDQEKHAAELVFGKEALNWWTCR